MQLNTAVKQLSHSTVRLETMLRDGDVGAGTALLYYADGGPTQATFLVTNKHVVHNAGEGTIIFTALKPGTGIEGKFPEPMPGQRIIHTIEKDFDRLWHGHPNKQVDVAVMPFDDLHAHLTATRGRPCIMAVSSKRVPTQEQIEYLDAVEDVLVVGYPNGVMDTINLNPVARLGVTATPYEYDYEGLPAFLIDASILPGSSGSPVFIVSHGNSVHAVEGPPRLFFLGLIAKVLSRTEDRGEVEIQPVPANNRQSARISTRVMIDLGMAFKAHTVDETIADLVRRGGLSDHHRRSLSYAPMA